MQDDWSKALRDVGIEPTKETLRVVQALQPEIDRLLALFEPDFKGRTPWEVRDLLTRVVQAIALRDEVVLKFNRTYS